MEYNQEVLPNQYYIVSFFVQHLAYDRGLSDAWGKIQDHDSFWAVTGFGHFELATIKWCKVFGLRAEDLHWTKTPMGDNAEQAREDFRNRVLSKTGFTKNEWKDYWKDVVAFRNQFLAHYDRNSVVKNLTKILDPALQVAYAYEEWAKTIDPELKERGSLRSRYEECKTMASEVVSLYSCP